MKEFIASMPAGVNPYKSSVLFCGTQANSADPDQTPQHVAYNQVLKYLQNVASAQVLHSLLSEFSIKI